MFLKDFGVVNPHHQMCFNSLYLKLTPSRLLLSLKECCYLPLPPTVQVLTTAIIATVHGVFLVYPSKLFWKVYSKIIIVCNLQRGIAKLNGYTCTWMQPLTGFWPDFIGCSGNICKYAWSNLIIVWWKWNVFFLWSCLWYFLVWNSHPINYIN